MHYISRRLKSTSTRKFIYTRRKSLKAACRGRGDARGAGGEEEGSEADELILIKGVNCERWYDWGMKIVRLILMLTDGRWGAMWIWVGEGQRWGDGDERPGWGWGEQWGVGAAAGGGRAGDETGARGADWQGAGWGGGMVDEERTTGAPREGWGKRWVTLSDGDRGQRGRGGVDRDRVQGALERGRGGGGECDGCPAEVSKELEQGDEKFVRGKSGEGQREGDGGGMVLRAGKGEGWGGGPSWGSGGGRSGVEDAKGRGREPKKGEKKGRVCGGMKSRGSWLKSYTERGKGEMHKCAVRCAYRGRGVSSGGNGEAMPGTGGRRETHKWGSEIVPMLVWGDVLEGWKGGEERGEEDRMSELNKRRIGAGAVLEQLIGREVREDSSRSGKLLGIDGRSGDRREERSMANAMRGNRDDGLVNIRIDIGEDKRVLRHERGGAGGGGVEGSKKGTEGSGREEGGDNEWRKMYEADDWGGDGVQGGRKSRSAAEEEGSGRRVGGRGVGERRENVGGVVESRHQ
ncbi:hypothetical protein Tco_1439936 [Tanacetum coccineum]